jgi:hypothetical protein
MNLFQSLGTRLNFDPLFFIVLFFLISDKLKISVQISRSHINISLAYILIGLFILTNLRVLIKKIITILCNHFLIIGLIAPFLCLSFFYSHNQQSSMIWFAWFTFNLITLIATPLHLEKKQISFEKLISTFTLTLAVFDFISSFQIFSFLFQSPIWQPQSHLTVYRLNGLANFPNFFSIYNFLLIPIILINGKKYEKYIASFGIYLLTLSTAKTGCMLILSLLILLVVFRKNLQTNSKMMAHLIVPFFLGLATPAIRPEGAYYSNARLMTSFFSELNINEIDSSPRERVVIFLQAMNIAVSNPITGVGPRAYSEYVNKREFEDVRTPIFSKYQRKKFLHNESIWSEIFSELGFVLGGIFLVIILVNLALYFEVSSSLVLTLILYYFVSGMLVQNFLLTFIYILWGIVRWRSEKEFHTKKSFIGLGRFFYPSSDSQSESANVELIP